MTHPEMRKRRRLKVLAKRLKRLRKVAGWSQQDLADRAGLSRTFVARLETEKQDPAFSTLVELAVALRVRLIDLLE